MKHKFTIIGSGALATALGKILTDSKHDVTIYGIDKNELTSLSRGINTKYFPNSVNLPNFNVSSDIKDSLKDADYIVIAVPSFAMDKVVSQIIKYHKKDVLLITGSKGFFPNSSLSLHEGINKEIKSIKSIRGVVSLIGPSHAEEMVLEMPTTIAAVDKNKKLCQEVQKLFFTNYFRVYVQTDVKGAEVGAAYKNVLAIAAGISQGLGYGINTLAALLTRGMAEMLRFNKLMKGKEKTLIGLTGLGDIIVTATSDLSRNFTFGKNVAKLGIKALETKITVEGIYSLKTIYKIAKEANISLPIVEFLYSILYKNNDPKNFMQQLWNRNLTSE